MLFQILFVLYFLTKFCTKHVAYMVTHYLAWLPVASKYLLDMESTNITITGELKRHHIPETDKMMLAGSFCDKNFSKTDTPKTNFLSYKGGKSSSCSQCDKAFSRAFHLNTHKMYHTGEKPFGCTQCNKAFSELGSLKKHKKSHTREKPFCCT